MATTDKSTEEEAKSTCNKEGSSTTSNETVKNRVPPDDVAVHVAVDDDDGTERKLESTPTSPKSTITTGVLVDEAIMPMPDLLPVEPGVDPLVLQRALPENNNLRQTHRPGAYMGAPGTDLQRNTTLDYNLVGAANGDGGPAPLVITNNNNNGPPNTRSDNQLAVANPVEEDPEAANREHANPVDVQAQEKKQQDIKKQQRTLLFILGLVLLAAAAIIGTLVWTAGKNKPVDESQAPAPTTYHSTNPSEIPSFAPTGALQQLLDTLPDYTLASLNNGSDTPQWKAWNWLANHQNITNLPDWKKTQLFALACFYYAFEGDKWVNPIQERWLVETKDECDWYSAGYGWITPSGEYVEFDTGYLYWNPLPCNDQGKFTSLDMTFGETPKIAINIPPEITLLTSLSVISLSISHFKETTMTEMIPTALYQMTSLETFSLHFYEVENDMGPIPTELGLITSLQKLWLPPGVSGQLPSTLTQLTELFIMDTSISGTIPSEIGLWTSMEHLDTINCPLLESPLPTELGQLTALTFLEMFSNELLTGQLPSELAMATSLSFVNLDFNSLTGWLPSEIGTMKNMTFLRLQGNMLSGGLPEELQSLSDLRGLYLSGNDFTGSIPTAYGEMQALTLLILMEMPLLTGHLPIELGLLANLGHVNISGSPGLTGTVPESLCYLQNASCTYTLSPSVVPCFLGFDCSDQLCGCDCPCPNNMTAL